MVRLWVFCVALCVVSPVFSATYEDTFTPKADKAYNEDLNVWVYTSKFAERFAMPKEWIDDGLKGAYAVAFRVEALSGRKMFPHKGEGVSMARRHCILDVYVDAEADIPWVDDQIADFKSYQPSSPSYLIPQSPEDQRWRGGGAIGMPDHGGVVRLGTPHESLGGLLLREYDRRLYPELVYISFAKSCARPPEGSAWIEFWHYKKVSVQQPAIFEYTAKATKRAHRIDIPESYMQRMYAHWFEMYGKGARAQWQDVIEPKTP